MQATPFLARFRTLIAGAFSVLCCAAALARPIPTHVLVGSYPAAAHPGEVVTIPVRLGYQDPHQGYRWVFLPHRALQVQGRLHGGVRSNVPYEIPDVRTDANGEARIRVLMPAKLVNGGGRPVATALNVTVRFAGEPPRLAPGDENRTIQIVIR